MTRKETLRIMAILKAAYPQYYSQMDASEAEEVAALWSEMLIDYSYELTAMAVKRYITQDHAYPPSIGQVIASINAIQRPPTEELTEGGAWSLVRRAISNGIYHSAEEFDRLPEIVKRIVGNHEQLQNWAMMDSDQVESQIRPMICRSFVAQAEREREQQALPPSIAKRLETMAQRPPMIEAAKKAPEIPAPKPVKDSFESPAYKEFLAELKALAESKEDVITDDDNRKHDAEAKANLQAQYDELIAAREVV